MLDIMNKYTPLVALAPGAKITATTNGAAVDLSSVNNGANGLMFEVVAGTITDGTYVFSLQDSPDNINWTNVNAPYVQTGPNGNTFTSATSAGTCTKLGYLGNPGGASRYVRLVTTVTSATQGAYLSAIALLGLNSNLPAA
jgi:hypothetical protein